MIKFLHEISTEKAGGKALGLRTLKELGLRVPDAFVLIHPDMERLDDDRLKSCLAKLGEGPKAVRSSAVSEDGQSASFAGQFETFLDLRTFDDIKAAIVKCITAAGNQRVRSYSGNLLTNADLRISVILQNMVDARIAGVVFTANPVNNRRDRIVVNAVAGKGEALVSGMKDARQYELFRSGSNISSELEKDGSLLDGKLLREIIDGAVTAEKHLKQPVDLEWAVDSHGVLHWLQVRPVTTLSQVHFNELDSVKEPCGDYWTLGNIGEMMPGVVTPLTYSVTAEAIDYGLMVMADRAGAFRMKDRTSPRYIQMFYNRLFFNMSHMMDYAKRVWLTRPQDIHFALSGKVFPEITASPEIALPARMINFFRQMLFTGMARKHLRMLKKLEAEYRIGTSGDIATIYENIGKAKFRLGVGFGHHLSTSSQSGTLYSTMMRIMTDDKRFPTAEDHHVATMLLLDIPGIESADAVKSLEKFASLIRNDASFAKRFIAAAPEQALGMVETEASQEIRGYFSAFLGRHGHRCVRESELREMTWAENPQLLIQSLQNRVRLGDARHQAPKTPKETGEIMDHLPPIKRMIIRALIPTARKAVARREISKALSIRMVNTMRKSYRVLAGKMTEAGLLDDTDQIYFLTHEEIGMLIRDGDPAWRIKAGKRRDILPELDKLTFNEVCHGIPEPLEKDEISGFTEGQLKGTPVSSGRVQGCARIVHTLADADMLKEGEIMVASFTDIGWTPYFSIIAGLVTEIGSPLSHGAVVAREYGIPAVVGAKGAKKFLADGDMIILDGDKGIIEKL